MVMVRAYGGGAFSGVIQNGSGTVGLTMAGSGSMMTLSGPSTYTGPTQINAGTLVVDTYVIPSAVTINSGGTLEGTGGTGPVTNLGGTYSANLYYVTIADSTLQRGNANSPNSGSASLVSGGNGVVLALSPAGAAFAALTGSATASSTSYALNPLNFTYVSDLVVTDSSDVSHDIGPAVVFSEGGGEDAGEGYGGFQPDYIPLTDSPDTTHPIAAADSYQDGVGGTLTKSSGAGLLANDTIQGSGSLSVASVDGSTSPGTIDTTGGTLTWSSDGSFSYTPNTGFFGTDTFTYIATDGTNHSDPTTVTINVLLPQLSLSYSGNPVLLSNDSSDPTGNADSSHLAQVSVAIDPDSVFASLPYNLTDWMLNLDAVGGGGSVDFWSSLAKTTELNNGGAGDQTWTFGSSLSSGSVPTNIWVAVNNQSSNNPLQIAWVTPSDSIVPTTALTQTITISGQPARLIAQQVNQSVSQGDLPANLQTSEGAYVPLDNADVTYDLSDGNQLVPDYQQSGPITILDPNLLQVDIKGVDGGAYWLSYSTTKIKVFTNPNLTGLIMPNSTEIDLDDSGNGYLYVQGVGVGVTTIGLKETALGAVVGKPLKVTVFQIDGAQDVPGSSTYQYAATGGLAGVEQSGFLESKTNGGKMSSLQNGNGGSATTEVTWDNKAEFGSIAYQAAPDFVWDYFVNVVQVNITDPILTTPGMVGQAVFRGFPAVLSAVASPFFAMASSADLVLVAPQIRYDGDLQYRGVNFIDVGYIQNAVGRTANVVFPGGGGLVNSAQYSDPGVGALLDEITKVARGQAHKTINPWYDTTLEEFRYPTPLVPGRLTMEGLFIGNTDTTTVHRTLLTSDTPFLSFPSPAILPPGVLTRFNLTYDFSLFIAGATSDATAIETAANQVFTAYAVGGWEFDGSGTLTVVGAGRDATVTWAALPSAGDSVYFPITTNVAGTYPITTKGDLFNIFLVPPRFMWRPA